MPIQSVQPQFGLTVRYQVDSRNPKLPRYKTWLSTAFSPDFLKQVDPKDEFRLTALIPKPKTVHLKADSQHSLIQQMSDLSMPLTVLIEKRRRGFFKRAKSPHTVVLFDLAVKLLGHLTPDGCAIDKDKFVQDVQFQVRMALAMLQAMKDLPPGKRPAVKAYNVYTQA